MSEIVFILGAGASKHAGAPLMADFLDRADELRKANKVGRYKSDFDNVFKAISSLQDVHSKSALDLDNIESVFAAFEMGRLINRFPKMSGEDIKSLLVSIRRLILKTLEETITYPVRDGITYPPESYRLFTELVKDLNDNVRRNKCSIITFNYDLALDYALYFNGYPPDYCLSEEAKKPGYVPLMKLHGSLNWARCSNCGEVIPRHLDKFFQQQNLVLRKLVLQKLEQVFPNNKSVPLPISSLLSDLEHCKEKLEPEPVIVPPTWNKTEYHQNLSKVWSRAASELSEAENIFVSGYSLPESDYFFRYLFALGSAGLTRIKRFHVFDPDNEVGHRFSTLIGQDTKKKFRHFGIRFEASIEPIRRELESIS